MHPPITLAMLAASLVNGPTTAHVSACPAENASVRGRVEGLIRSAAAQALRERDGWASVRVADLRLLTDVSDAAACQWLRDNITFPPGARTTVFYGANGFYVVGSERVRDLPPGTILLGGWEAVIVIGPDGTLVGSYAT